MTESRTSVAVWTSAKRSAPSNSEVRMQSGGRPPPPGRCRDGEASGSPGITDGEGEFSPAAAGSPPCEQGLGWRSGSLRIRHVVERDRRDGSRLASRVVRHRRRPGLCLCHPEVVAASLGGWVVRGWVVRVGTCWLGSFDSPKPDQATGQRPRQPRCFRFGSFPRRVPRPASSIFRQRFSIPRSFRYFFLIWGIYYLNRE